MAREHADACLVIKPAGSSSRMWHKRIVRSGRRTASDLLQTPGAASLWRTAGLRGPSVVRTPLSAPRS